MRLLLPVLAALAAILILPGFATAAPGEITLAEGVKLACGDQPIDVEVGHAVPVAVDWDDDGKKDLLVGQFGGGKIRLYRNTGTDAKPLFEGFEFLKAGGKEISVPCG